MKLLIISPHLDDAVLSCGARIAQAVQSGDEVLAATCFTSPGEGATTELQALYERRRADDLASLTLLGAGSRHLGFVDAPFRNALYYNFSTILFHHRLPSEERPLLVALEDALRRLAEEWRPDEILFPLGVGGHIDHHLVWESSKVFWDGAVPEETFAGRACRVSYYEDLPYALIPGWSAVRWKEVGGVALADWPAGPGEAESGDEALVVGNEAWYANKIDLLQAPYPFVQNYMSSPEDRALSVGCYDKEFEGVGSGLWNVGVWAISGRTAVRNLYRAEAGYFRDKCKAIAGYSSEWPVLFGPDERNIPEMLRRCGGMLAGSDNRNDSDFDYTEISWTLKTM